MNYYEHSLISVRKFGGELDWYIPIHSFIDSSKYYYPNFKHRILLHHTFGAEICVKTLGYDYLPNGVLVRDVAFEHIKEDHGKLVTLNDWFNAVRIDNYNTYQKFKEYIYNSEFGIDKDISDKNLGKIQTILDNITFYEKWTYSPDIKEIKWLKDLKKVTHGN